MIRRAQKLGYKVNVYAPGNSEVLLKYGNENRYYSYVNSEKTENKEIIFHFPESPVNVKKIKIETAFDVFPNKWEIQISRDNETYESLKQSNEPFCKKEYTVDYFEKSYACSIADENIFVVSRREDQHAYFVKFVMISNTYYDSSNYANLITLFGFELIGDLYIKFKPCSFQKKSFINHYLFIFVLTIYSCN